MAFVQPIQMIGTQRSGSNMLRLMLNQMSEISAPHPPHILQRFMPLLSAYGDLTNKKQFERLVDDVCTLVELNPVPWRGVQFNRNEVVSRCNSASLIEVFRVVYELKAEQDGAKFWLCKSMANVKYVGAMEETGMHPKYIYLYRDGRDVACSFQKAIVGEKHVFHIARQWAGNQQACIDLRQKTSSDRFISVSYENLLLDPETEMKRICYFLNIPFRAEVFDFYRSEESKNTAVAGKMWENVSQPILKNNTQKYKTGLSPMEIAIFEKQAGHILEELGYPLEKNGLLNGHPFSDAEIASFDIENQQLKQKALQSTDPEGMKLREPQEELLKKILLTSEKNMQ